ncbi:hypothetical protein QEN19_003744 [Hanseniaspora menglaensis]
MSDKFLFRAFDGTVYYKPKEYTQNKQADELINPDAILQTERMVRWRVENNKHSTDKSLNFHYSLYTNIYIVNSKKAGKTSNYDLQFKHEFATLYYDVMKRYNEATTLIETDTFNSIQGLGLKIKQDWEQKSKSTKTLIIMLSGDTSISELLNGSSLKPCIDILTVPFGTANALFLKLFEFPRGLKLNEDLAVEAREIMLEVFQKFVQNKLELFKVPFYTISNKENKTLFKSILLTTTGFHATLLKVASSPEYKKYGVERFRIAASEVISNYKFSNKVKLYNTKGKIYFDGISSYFGVFGTGRLERDYDISPLSTLEERSFLSIKEKDDRDAFVNNIMAGYGSKDDLLKLYNENESINNEKIDLDEELVIEIKKIYPDSDISVCVDGYILDLQDISTPEMGSYIVKIKTEHDSNVQFFKLNNGIFSDKN